jgi:hypothetical protein
MSAPVRKRRELRGRDEPLAARRKNFSLGDQPLRIAVLQIEAAQALARSAKSWANLLCHARAVSVTARWAAIRSSIARRL